MRALPAAGPLLLPLVALLIGMVKPSVSRGHLGWRRCRAEGKPLTADGRARVVTDRIDEQGNLQCAYHGWSFASDGACTNIPQVGCRLR
jgi:hypothetical protein